MATPENIGAKVRAAREARAWTQEKLAEVSGVSVRTVQRVEANSIASFDTVHRLRAALGLRSEELLKPAPGGDAKLEFTFLPRLDTGTAVTAIIDGAEAYLPRPDEPENEAEAELMGRFLDQAHDWGEIWDDISPGERVKVALWFKATSSQVVYEGLKHDPASITGFGECRGTSLSGSSSSGDGFGGLMICEMTPRLM